MIAPPAQGIGQTEIVIPKGFKTRRRGVLRVGTGRDKNLRSGEITYLWVSRLIIWVFMAIVLVPLMWVLGQSFQPGFIYTPSITPNGFTWDNYHTLFKATDFLLWVRNSAVICTSVGLATVLLVATMAYAFSRFTFRGRTYGLMALLLIQMFPAQMAFIAFYKMLNGVNLYDHIFGLVLVFIGGSLPFNAWLFKGYIDSLPVDLEEAAYVDGASKFQAYIRIILPLTRPMMAVIFLFVWFGLYSEFFLTSFLLPSQSNWTVAVGLYGMINGAYLQNWTLFAAGAVIGTIPVMLVFLAAQRFLVAGLARGAVKG